METVLSPDALVRKRYIYGKRTVLVSSLQSNTADLPRSLPSSSPALPSSPVSTGSFLSVYSGLSLSHRSCVSLLFSFWSVFHYDPFLRFCPASFFPSPCCLPLVTAEARSCDCFLCICGFCFHKAGTLCSGQRRMPACGVGWVGGTRGGAGPSFPAVVARALPFWDSRLCLLHTCWETSSCLLICFAVSVEEQGKRDCGPRSSGSGSEGSRSHRCSPWCRTSADLSGYIPSCPAIPLSPVHPQWDAVHLDFLGKRKRLGSSTRLVCTSSPHHMALLCWSLPYWVHEQLGSGQPTHLFIQVQGVKWEISFSHAYFQYKKYSTSNEMWKVRKQWN